MCVLSCSDQYDSHDERDDDGEGESVEEHKSVIMHLLSQVRLGMDLTKVTFGSTSAFLLLLSLACPPSMTMLLSFLGGFTDIYIGEKVVARDVCRLLCTPGFVRQVKYLAVPAQHFFPPECTGNVKNK